eukprot:2649712-Prymnesium_polylepis.2
MARNIVRIAGVWRLFMPVGLGVRLFEGSGAAYQSREPTLRLVDVCRLCLARAARRLFARSYSCTRLSHCCWVTMIQDTSAYGCTGTVP